MPVIKLEKSEKRAREGGGGGGGAQYISITRALRRGKRGESSVLSPPPISHLPPYLRHPVRQILNGDGKGTGEIWGVTQFQHQSQIAADARGRKGGGGEGGSLKDFLSFFSGVRRVEGRGRQKRKGGGRKFALLLFPLFLLFPIPISFHSFFPQLHRVPPPSSVS